MNSDDELYEMARAALQAADATRYRFVRTLSVPQFADLFNRNLQGEGPFDTLVDRAMGSSDAR